MTGITVSEVKTSTEKKSQFYNEEQKRIYIKNRLHELFSNEINSQNSIFVKVNDNVINKITSFITGEIKRSCSVGIAGETASGKSTVAYDVINKIQDFADKYNLSNVISRINIDDYYYDRSEMVKAAGSFAEFAKHYDLDIPEALELELMKEHMSRLLKGEDVYLPKYDMSGTAKRYDNFNLVKPAKIIISEGLFALTDKIVDAFDFKIYVDVSVHTQKSRFYIRAAERDLGDSTEEVYQNASRKAQIYVHPTMKKADIILSGEANRDDYKKFINELINIIFEVHNIA
jgi:uridine kinase